MKFCWYVYYLFEVFLRIFRPKVNFGQPAPSFLTFINQPGFSIALSVFACFDGREQYCMKCHGDIQASCVPTDASVDFILHHTRSWLIFDGAKLRKKCVKVQSNRGENTVFVNYARIFVNSSCKMALFLDKITYFCSAKPKMAQIQ